MRARRFRCGGISLIEVLIAVAIFVTAFLMLLGIFPTGLRSVQQARTLTLGTYLAEQKLEVAHAMNYQDINPTNLPSENIPVTMVNNNVQSTTTYTVQYQITENTGFGGATDTSRTVQVQVSWDDGTQLRVVRMSTDVMNPEALLVQNTGGGGGGASPPPSSPPPTTSPPPASPGGGKK